MAQLSGGSQTSETYIAQMQLYENCKKLGLLNTPGYPQCAFASVPTPGSTELMGTMVNGQWTTNPPLVGLSGGVVDSATIETSITGDESTTDDEPSSGSDEDTAGGGGTNCNNGIWMDGCEDGSQRLVSAYALGSCALVAPWHRGSLLWRWQWLALFLALFAHLRRRLF